MFGLFGLLYRLMRRLVVPTIICVFITFCPNIPPNATYTPYENELKSPLIFTPDTTLNNAERILEGQLVGAEAFTVNRGVLYTGLHGGNVVKVLPNNVVPVVKTGKDCAGIHQEHICGRPLGLRVRNDVLYIADAYNGIFSHVITDGPGKPNHLLGPNIEVNGKPVNIFNSLEVDKDGIIYFTSSSSEFDINKGLHALLAPGTGRLLRFDPRTMIVKQLLDNMLFSNGLALSSDEEFLFISETVARRVLKYHIKTGNVQAILEGLPGLPDNIQYAGDNTFWVSLVSSSDQEYPSLSDVLANWPNIRKFLGRALFLLELPFKLINQHYPNSFCEMASYHIGHLGPIFAMLPEKVTIVRFDGNTGKILDVLHGNNGVVRGISDVAVVGDYMYLGSPANNFIGRLSLANNLKGRFAQTEEASRFRSDPGANAKRAAEEAQARKAAEEARDRKATEASARHAAEEAKARQAADAKARQATEAKTRQAVEEAKARQAAEEARARQAAEEARARQAAEEARARQAAEEARARQAAEEARARQAAEAKTRQAAEEARARQAAEEARARQAAEEARARQAAEEARARQAAEEARRAAAARPKEAEANKRISEEEIRSNKISEDTGRSKVHGDKVKTEL